jgi:hypothetical protein
MQPIQESTLIMTEAETSVQLQTPEELEQLVAFPVPGQERTTQVVAPMLALIPPTLPIS